MIDTTKERLDQFLSDSAIKPTSIWEHAFLSPADIPFSADVRAACEVNYCGRYGKCWTCPPGAGDWQVLRDHFRTYEHAFVFTTCHSIEDSFDFEGMDEARRLHDLLDEALLTYLDDLKFPHELAGAGSCSLCTKCTYPDAPCRQPRRARRSMEACGMDVVALSKVCNIHYINGADTVTYFSVLFW